MNIFTQASSSGYMPYSHVWKLILSITEGRNEEIVVVEDKVEEEKEGGGGNGEEENSTVLS